MKEQQLLNTGLVIEVMPNMQYKIELSDGKIVRAYLGGKMRMNRISVVIGDRVEFVVDTQGANNRIVKRLK